MVNKCSLVLLFLVLLFHPCHSEGSKPVWFTYISLKMAFDFYDSCQNYLPLEDCLQKTNPWFDGLVRDSVDGSNLMFKDYAVLEHFYAISPLDGNSTLVGTLLRVTYSHDNQKRRQQVLWETSIR